ncbi:MAG: methyl-accepting chemotaxis protein [Sphingomonadales bacterium]
MAKFEPDAQGRLAFLAINQKTFEILGKLWPSIEPRIIHIVGGFFDHLTSVPHLRKALKGVDFEKLKQRQVEHWQQLFTQGIDDAFIKFTTDVGAEYHKLGFEPRWFLGSYAVEFRGFQAVANRTFRNAPKELAAATTAINKIHVLVTEVLVSSYYAASRQAARAELEKHARAFETGVLAMVDSVAAATSQVRDTTRNMLVSATEASDLSSSVKEASNRASENVQAVASAAEELAASVSEVSRQVLQAAQATDDAATEADGSTETISSLMEASERIGDVVKLISDIASQTNLLSLNATIEAARAGDAGRGFAVVASEVKTLAGQTAKATGDIAAQIGAIQQATKRVVAANDKITGSIGNVRDVSAAIASAIEQQGATAAEISRNINNAANGTEEVSDGTNNVDGASRRTGDAAREVSTAAEDIAGKVATLNTQVQDFLIAVRSH